MKSRKHAIVRTEWSLPIPLQAYHASSRQHLAAPIRPHPRHTLQQHQHRQSNMLASGFTNAPVTRLLVFGIVASSFVASLTDTKYYFWIEVRPHLFDYGQFWRLLTWQLCYTNSTEVLFAAMTFYQLRVIERLWGSRKFAVCVNQGPYSATDGLTGR